MGTPGGAPSPPSPPSPLSLLLALALLCPGVSAGGSCPAHCICASNLLSCSQANLSLVPSPLPRFASVLDLSHNNVSRLRGDWSPARLPHLHTLLLSHNRLAFVSTEAFAAVPRLRHLDLSNNCLRALDENLFSDLGELEVLLLYNNEISSVDRTAFENLGQLRKLYLGRNRIARFPLELLREGSRLPRLALLDLSANRLREVPAGELQALPAWLRDRLYLHDNPLGCNCALFQLLARGRRRRLSAVLDFQEELTCHLPGSPHASVAILELAGRQPLNCSEAREAVLEAHLGDSVTLGCDSRWQDGSRHWVTPAGDRVMPGDGGGNGTAALLANGSLELRALRAEDAGTYACWVAGPLLNETLYVELLVHNFTLHGPHDTLNTAYTTLVGCILSVVLVLIYLYLTPCRCCCCRAAEKAPAPRDDSINSSVLSTTPNHDGGHGEPRPAPGGGPGQNGRFKGGGGTPPPAAPRGPKGQRKVSDPDSVSSVFSDTPIVV
ncbi:PREDICTED: amphoterin-induced protein 1 [Lepidothrix coronata]|uniref:Amphoterin-induced protein 1 n=1 Tax=Lepidothrix coronata TaxID=321398 RepID=A0A6J0J9Z2_9PASS|nr:PREDICTED: amphoterin-induced protein 1 [Lepidothrix coronata]